MASVPPIQELTDLINNLDKYLENVDENTSLPPKEVQDRARNMLTKLNRLLFIFNQVAIRSHDGTAIYSVDQLLHNIKWGGEGYGSFKKIQDVINMYPKKIFLLNQAHQWCLVKERDITNVHNTLESAAQSTVFWFAKVCTKHVTFSNLNEEDKCMMLAHFLNDVDRYGIAFADPQFKIARFFIATRWENTVKKRKAK
ncbi:hypothetical protein J3F82_002158 [Coemansia sp. RSA 637]|nr:hypothetical protein J3F82_002158 [Coemansia sp. RSA 637]